VQWSLDTLFKNNHHGSRLRGRPKSKWRNCVRTDINEFKIKNWKERSNNRADWKKSVKEAKVRNWL